MRKMTTPAFLIMLSVNFLNPWSTDAQTSPSLAITRVGSSFSRPVFVTSAPGETERLFVIEQHTGRIRILKPATQTIETQPFLTVTNVTRGGEQGLLGLVFHPGYASNGVFFVNYTTTGGGSAGHTEITRFKVQGDPATSNVADPASKAVILQFNQPEENHNAGWIGFGLDGYLYIGTGDGGGGDDRHGSIGNGQNRNTLLGKILRIDVNQGEPYVIPDGNPFKGVAERREEIWAFGLRNPWRCSIDRLTGDLWIGDVGQRTREEISFNPVGMGGLNFGWRPREGLVANPTFTSETPVTEAIDPVHDYPRSSGVSVVGGYIYRGSAIPSLQGVYVFADYGTSRFWSLRYDGTNKVDFQERTAELNSGTPRPIRNISSFGEDADGELYICDIEDGEIFKIIPSQPTAISISEPSVAEGIFRFTFTGVTGQSYFVEWTESILPAAWQTLTNITATAPNLVVTDALSGSQRFYRVRRP